MPEPVIITGLSVLFDKLICTWCKIFGQAYFEHCRGMGQILIWSRYGVVKISFWKNCISYISPLGISAPKIVGLPVSSTCFMLSNMFDPTAETEPGWDADIRDDVLEECSVHGPVLHIHVDTYSQVTSRALCS